MATMFTKYSFTVHTKHLFCWMVLRYPSKKSIIAEEKIDLQTFVGSTSTTRRRSELHVHSM